MRDLFLLLLALAFVAFMLARYILASQARKKQERELLFSEASQLLADADVGPGKTIGSLQLNGRYQDLPVQAEAIVDTLNVRKLPSLWLMVTMPDPMPVKATFDLMMRPSGPSTFSNFEFLPLTVETPPDFPEYAVIRSDDPARMPPAFLIAPHLGSFLDIRGKELLVTPKGLRVVTQLAEAQRARYGVFRQAEFGSVVLQAQEFRHCLDLLVSLRQAIMDWSARQQ